jgi:hypothetical protein
VYAIIMLLIGAVIGSIILPKVDIGKALGWSNIENSQRQ